MKVCAECGRCYKDSVDFCSEGNHQDLSRLRDGDPEMVAGYRLEHLLESGVRGESYRARQTQCGRSCLIRILSADKANTDQFASEARLAAAFFHPSIVDVYEAGSLPGGELFVVAEDAGRPVGFVQVATETTAGEIVGMWVLPAFMGRGIGKAPRSRLRARGIPRGA